MVLTESGSTARREVIERAFMAHEGLLRLRFGLGRTVDIRGMGAWLCADSWIEDFGVI